MKFKLKPKTEQRIKEMLFEVIFSLGIAFSIFGFALFFIGFHNLDLAQNVMRISYFEGLNYSKFIDCYDLEGNCMTMNSAYIYGAEQMRRSIIFIFIGGIFIGFSSANFRREKNG